MNRILLTACFLLLGALPARATEDHTPVIFNCAPTVEKTLPAPVVDTEAQAREAGAEGGLCTAWHDVNSDGRDDLFVRFEYRTYLCGSLGCATSLYLAGPGDIWVEQMEVYSHFRGLVLGEEIDGRRVVYVDSKKACPCNKVAGPDGSGYLDNWQALPFVFDKAGGQYIALHLPER